MSLNAGSGGGGDFSDGLGLLQEDDMFPVQDDADEDLLADLMGVNREKPPPGSDHDLGYEVCLP